AGVLGQAGNVLQHPAGGLDPGVGAEVGGSVAHAPAQRQEGQGAAQPESQAAPALGQPLQAARQQQGQAGQQGQHVASELGEAVAHDGVVAQRPAQQQQGRQGVLPGRGRRRGRLPTQGPGRGHPGAQSTGQAQPQRQRQRQQRKEA